MHDLAFLLLVDLLRYIQSAIFLSAAYLAASAHVERETLVPLLDWQMFPEIAASSEVDTLVAVLVGSQLGGVYGTIEALFLPNTSGVVAGVAAGVVGAVDIVVDFAAPASPAAAAAVVAAAAAAGVAAAAGAAAAASAAAAGSAAAGAAAVEGASAYVDVGLVVSVGLASYPMGACMPLARRYLPLISTENPLGTWMMASEAARIHRYCPPLIEPFLRRPHRLVVPAY